jgi:hypothetical protein
VVKATNKPMSLTAFTNAKPNRQGYRPSNLRFIKSAQSAISKAVHAIHNFVSRNAKTASCCGTYTCAGRHQLFSYRACPAWFKSGRNVGINCHVHILNLDRLQIQVGSPLEKTSLASEVPTQLTPQGGLQCATSVLYVERVHRPL